MKATYLFFAFLLSFQYRLHAQVGIGTATPNASSALEIKDSTKGILIPRMKMQKRLAIANPAEGLMVYQTDSTAGFWYFKANQWKNIDANNGGKHTDLLTDDISDQQAQAKIAAEFGPNTQEIVVRWCSNLTTLDFSALTSVISIELNDNPLLQSVNFQNLKTCDDDIYISGCPNLNTLSFPSLTRVSRMISLNVSALNTLAFPMLTRLGILFIYKCSINNLQFPSLSSLNQISINSTPLASLSCPLLTSINQFFLQDNNLSNISFPILSKMGSFRLINSPPLTALSFPALTQLTDSTTGFLVSDCSNLTSITFNNLSVFKLPEFNVYNNKLPSSQVNYLLNKLVSISPPLTGKSIYLPQIPAAPPTGQGVSDKATLIGNGNTVQTD